MSHYVVLVLSEENQSIEELLEPYDENIEVEPYVSKTKQEVIQQGKEYQSRMKKQKEENEKFQMDDYIQKLFACQTDDAFYDFMRNEYYQGSTFDVDGDLLSTYNPKSKWDWWVEGGRFCNYLLPYLKKTFLEDETDVEIHLKDISFESIPQHYESAKRFWEIYVEKQPLEEGEKEPFTLLKEDYYKKRYGTKEEYCKEESCFCPYAVVTPDGEWHEPGRMGWFGCSCASIDDEKEWFSKCRKMLMKLQKEQPDLIVNVIDCHI